MNGAVSLKLPDMMDIKMAENTTTIKVSRKTKERLEHFRIYKRETYEEILEKMLDILNLCRMSPGHARMNLIKIDGRKKEEADLKKDVYSEKYFNPPYSHEEPKPNERSAPKGYKSRDKIMGVKVK